MKKMMYYIWAIFLPQITHAAITVPSGTGLPSTDLDMVIEDVLYYVLSFVAILSILSIVVSGIIYITSGGESKRTDQAKGWLTYSIVGLVVAILGYAIVKSVGLALGVNWR